MLKLYKRIDTQLHYWETWDTTNKSTIVHWGMVGEKGFQREEKLSLFSNFRKKIQKEIDKLLSEGYHQIDIDDHITLLIEYDLTRLDPIEALKKRHRLEDRMNQTLGWIGLGNCDGGSIGSGTMEVCCLVVDFPIAKDAIIKDLRETEFSDYSRIFEEKYLTKKPHHLPIAGFCLAAITLIRFGTDLLSHILLQYHRLWRA